MLSCSTHHRMWFFALSLILAMASPSFLWAQNSPHSLNVSGGLFTSSGAAVAQAGVNFKIEILDKNATCVLYSEQHLNQDLTNTKGAFSLLVGEGTSIANTLEGTTAFTAKIFENNGATGAFTGCASGVTNASGDERLIRIYYDLGAGFIAMTPDVPIVSAPFALVAETLQGKNSSDFAQINTGSAALSQANLENIFSNVNYPKLNALVNGSSTQYMVSSPSSAVGFNGQRISSVGTPTAATDAANKSYVDGNVGGKTVDVTGVGAGVGGGKTLVWDQALNKWVAQTPSAALSQIVAGTGLVSNTITTTGTLAVDVGTTANKIVQLNAQGKLPALDGFLLTNIAFPVTSVAGRTGTVVLNAADISGLGTAATQAYGTAASNLVQLNASAQLPAVDGSLLTNINATKLQSRSIATTAPVAGQVLTWNATTSVWEPRSAAVSGITDLTGDVSASGSGSVAATIANSAITSAKINASGYAINRILITDSVNPNLVTYANCSNGDVLRYGPTGWLCNSAVGGLSLLVSGTGLVAGSITTAGTLNVDVGTTAGKVLQVTAGGQYPAIDGNLMSNINAVKIQTRNIASTAPAGGQVLGWNSTSNQWEPTSTSGVGTVTGIYAGTGLVGNTITASGTLAVDVGSTANKIVQLTSSAQYPGADGALIANINAVKLQTRSIASTAPAANQVLTWNNSTSQWEPQAAQTGANAFVQNGNAFGTAANLGTTDFTNLNFVTNNSTKMTITNNGNVGIGTTAPSGTLSIYSGGAYALNILNSSGSVLGGVGSGGSFTATNGSASGPGYNFRGDQTSGVYLAAYANVEIATNGLDRMRIDSNGSVGIGTISPGAALDVNGTGTFSGLILPRDSTSNRPAAVNGMLRYNTNTSKFEAYEAGSWANVIGTPSNAFLQNGNSFGATATLGTTDVTNLNFLTCNNTQMTLNSRGQLGIGVLNPSVKLDISFGPASGNNDYVAKFNNSTGGLAIGALNADGLITPTAAAGGVRFRVGPSLQSDAAYLTPAGALGIGTITPNVALDVSGTGTFSGLIVPRDTTGLRPASVNGTIRYNTNTSKFEAYEAGAWTNIIGAGANSFVQNGNAFGTNAQLGTTDVTNLNFLTCNNTQMTITSKGYVGIGTTTPIRVMQVDEGSGIWPQILSNRTNGQFNGIGISNSGTRTMWMRYDFTNSVGMIATEVSSPLTLGTSGVERMRIDSSTGYVGVGTTTPSQILDVSTTNSSVAGIKFSNLSNSTNAQARLFLYNDAGNYGSINLFSSTNINSPNLLTISSPSVAGGHLSLNAGGAEIMRMVVGGNVGIGTTTPARRLEISGTDGMRLDPTALPGTPAAGDIVIDSGASNTLKYYNGSGWVSSGSGTVTSVTSGTGLTPNTISLNGTLNVDVGTIANKIVQLTASAQYPAIDGNLISNINAVKLQSRTVALTAPAANQVLTWNTSTAQWEPQSPQSGATAFVNGGNAFGSNASLGTTDLTNLTLITNNSSRMSITYAGNVGIGTNSPAARLDVVGAIDINGQNAISFPPDTVPNASVAIGVGSLAYQTAGAPISGNVAVGYMAMASGSFNAASRQNTGVGLRALNSMTNANYNSAFGASSLFSDTTGNGNSAFGVSALNKNTTGTLNTAVGYQTLFNNTTGNNNTAIGYNVGSTTLATGFNNILIGTSSAIDTPTSSTSNFLNIGNLIFGTGVSGSLASPAGNVGIGSTSPVVALDVNGTGTFSGIIIPRDSTAMRPSGVNGMIRYNINTSKFEAYENGSWSNVISSSTNAFLQNGNAFGANANLGTTDSYKLNLLTNNAARLTISPSGYVGIGNTSPSAILDVQGGTASAGLDGTDIRLVAQSAGLGNMSGGNIILTPGIATGSGAAGDVTVEGSLIIEGLNEQVFNLFTVTTDPTGFIANSSVVDGVLYPNANSKYIASSNSIDTTVSSSAPTTIYVGQVGEASVAQAVGTTGGSIYGAQFTATPTDVGTITAATGVLGTVAKTGGGTTLLAKGGDFSVTNSAGTINTAYGVYISNVQANNSYSIYAADVTAPSFLAGLLGIGNSSPNVALDVNGTGTFSGLIVPRATTAFRPSGVNGMLRYNTNTSKFEFYENGAWVNHNSSNSGFVNGGNAFGSNASLGITDNYNLNLLANNATRMTIASSGYVGIGNTSPRNQLDVNNVVRVTGQGSATASGVQIYNNNSGSYTGWWLGTSGASSNLSINADTSENTGTPKMTITPSGSVGVGAINPAAKLDVATGGTQDILMGQVSNNTTYSVISFNGKLADPGNVGIEGGGGTDQSLYVNSGAGGSIVMRPNAVGGAPNSTNTFTVSGTQSVFLNGNVGIGTTTPNARLEVNSKILVSNSTNGSATNISEVVSDSTYGGYLHVRKDGTNEWFLQADPSSTATLNFRAGNIINAPAMAITTSGNVGIGTTSPGRLLDLYKSSSTVSAEVGIIRGDNVNQHAGYISQPAGSLSGSNVQWESGLHSNRNSFEFWNWNGTSELNALAITNSGNVGIGTTTPNVALDVNGSGTSSGLIVPRSTTALRPASINGTIRYNTNTSKFEFYEGGSWINYSASSSGFVNGGNGFGSNASLGTTDVTNLSFLTCNNSQMTITSSGYVGIGTSNPNQTLDVNGNIRVGSQTTRTSSTNRGQLGLGSTYVVVTNSSTTVDWNKGNIQELNTFLCDGVKTITMNNMQDGAVYTLLLSGTAAHSGTCLFSSPGFTFKTPGGNTAPTSSKDILWTFAVINTTVIYTMMDNLQ